MADAKIVNIKGVQWDLKDQVARNNITEINTTLEGQKKEIDDINKNMYINKIVYFPNSNNNEAWVRIDGLYPKGYFENNIFVLTTHSGEYHQICCGLKPDYTPVNTLWFRFFGENYTIKEMRFKGETVWLKVGPYTSFRIQQFIGNQTNIKMLEETPPSDAINIVVKQITTS